MAAVRKLLTAFLGGEISPLLSGRVDTEQYAYGLATCENFVPVNEGPLVKRPGFAYVCDADATSSWLSAFRFSITQEYMLEWGAAKLRFYTNDARIETSPGVAYEVVTPYAAADAPRISSQQNYDRLYLNHGSYPPAALSRTGAATFAHANITLNNGPFLDQNRDETATITVSGTLTVGGAITVSCTAAIFAASDVGSQLRIEARDFSTIKSWEPGMTGVVAGDVVRSEGKAYTALTSGTTGTKIPTHWRGAEYDGQGRNDLVNAKGPYGVQWEFRHDLYGIVEIGGFTSTTQVTGTVKRRVPDSVSSVGTHRWSLAAFSATRGWPQVVRKAFGRMIHFKDLDVIGTVVGDYGGGQMNFETTTDAGALAADLGFRRTLDASDPPLWAVVDRELLVGTASGELAIGAINSAAAVAGDNIRSQPQSYYGSETVWPETVGTRIVFVERGGRRVRSAEYDFGRDRYVPEDLTAASRHITRGGLLQLALQRSPHALLYAVRGDGQLIVHADTRGEIKGWARTVCGGAAEVLSAVSIVGADGKTDTLWLLVERTRADGVKREIWRQQPWRDLGEDADEQFYVDAGVRIEASAGQTAFTGLTHLADTDIAVLAGGAVVPGVSVASDGSFTLPAAAAPDVPYILIAGLPYTALAVTLRAEVALRGGSIQGLLKRVRKVVLRLLETVGIKAGALDGVPEDLIDRPASAAMDAPIPLFSGDTSGPIDMDHDRDGQVRFVSDRPLAAIITAAMLSLEVDEADA